MLMAFYAHLSLQCQGLLIMKNKKARHDSAP